IYIDELLAQQQVVIKSLETNYTRVPGISGATILGDGTVALILDVPGVVELSRNLVPVRFRSDTHEAVVRAA
ncbi:MAG: chemotaxis protein CheW, partial [Gammaproteobacteria bacterium]